jgi:hypothetical protein
MYGSQATVFARGNKLHGHINTDQNLSFHSDRHNIHYFSLTVQSFANSTKLAFSMTCCAW